LRRAHHPIFSYARHMFLLVVGTLFMETPAVRPKRIEPVRFHLHGVDEIWIMTQWGDPNGCGGGRGGGDPFPA
jgi:hypothetical protein